jgi:membrane protease YdiL (CAAX protease family)
VIAPAAGSDVELAAARRGGGREGLLVLAGVAGLLMRTGILELAGADRVVALGCLYAAILTACLLAAAPRSRARINQVIVLLIGAGAVAVAAAAAGRPPAMGFAPLSLPLSVLAALAEEALFRKTAYAWLLRHGAPMAIIGSAILFALVHLPFYGASAMPVDLGAGLLFGWQRWASGDWTAPAATHAAANILAVIIR